MSIRPPVDRQRIDDFLRRLGTRHATGRLYLVGGSALVHLGMRGRTLDIDVALEPPGEPLLLEAIRHLKDELQVNVKLAAPADFVPLPAGWQDRARFVGRFGSVDVYYFDFYSIALSKLVRGSQRDIEDLALMIGAQLIVLDEFDEIVQQSMSLLGTGRYFNIDPAVVAARYDAVRQQLQQQQGGLYDG